MPLPTTKRHAKRHLMPFNIMRKYLLFLLATLLFSSVNAFDSKSINITRSLAYDAKKSGISPQIVKEIVRIFSWKIDFSRDLRRGDRFIIIGNKGAAPKAIIYNSGKKRVAVFSYVDKFGRLNYYAINGKTLYPSFLRNPVKYRRISSKFQRKRFHPILKTWLPHRAVDYAANKGSKVYASADGVVEKRKYIGALGNAIYLKHGANYVSVYAHLLRFARGLRVGKKVKKGQVIGLVGSTGRSTGSHLHYELRYKGKRKNPLTWHLPKQKRVPAPDLRRFQSQAREILRNFR
ncbi:MAG: peptidoglycan DD-metalloendopeptidase family protein [Candidatus Thioglobus sp.]|nr:MAG: peptidoglycan DD-metalloendopeptidase family protein [Candidatus Thioglobus sp.]